MATLNNHTYNKSGLQRFEYGNTMSSRTLVNRRMGMDLTINSIVGSISIDL